MISALAAYARAKEGGAGGDFWAWSRRGEPQAWPSAGPWSQPSLTSSGTWWTTPATTPTSTGSCAAETAPRRVSPGVGIWSAVDAVEFTRGGLG